MIKNKFVNLICQCHSVFDMFYFLDVKMLMLIIQNFVVAYGFVIVSVLNQLLRSV